MVVRMAWENRSWDYDRIVGALVDLGYTIGDQTVGNLLKRHSIPPAPERKTTVTWREFIHMHMDVLGATDFFNSEIWSGFRLLIAFLLCLIRCGTQYVHAVGRLLYQRRHAVHCLGLRALDGGTRIQRWVYGITTFTQAWAIRCRTELQCMTRSTFTPAGERPLRPQALGTVACLSAAVPSRYGMSATTSTTT